MALDEPVGRKQKKLQRDAERLRKGKKRKRDEVEVQDGPAQDELQQDFIPLNDGVEDEPVAPKQKSRKRKAEAIQQDNSAPEVVNGTSQPPTPKTKKRKKSKPDTATANEDEADEDPTTSNKGTKSRFILFIGNLPYSTTDASLQTHFKKLSPFTLRHRTDPKTKKSKGFAFLEFENYDRMKTCLKLYHHTIFDPAKGESDGVTAEGVTDSKKKKDKGRKINVELTAGGGGKAEGRKEKIKAKNFKLDGQRKRRLEEERKGREKERAGKKASGGGGDDDEVSKKKAGGGADRLSEKKAGGGAEKLSKKKSRGASDAPPKKQPDPEPVKVVDDTGGMHPSRLARLQK